MKRKWYLKFCNALPNAFSHELPAGHEANTFAIQYVTKVVKNTFVQTIRDDTRDAMVNEMKLESIHHHDIIPL